MSECREDDAWKFCKEMGFRDGELIDAQAMRLKIHDYLTRREKQAYERGRKEGYNDVSEHLGDARADGWNEAIDEAVKASMSLDYLECECQEGVARMIAEQIKKLKK